MGSFAGASKALIVGVFVILLVSWDGLIAGVEAAGECGKTPIESAAAGLTPCLGAVRDAKAKVTAACCSKVGAMFNSSPKCLCAILLSPLAKQVGINPAIAITVPKRCNIRNRPVGKKCGKYTLP
nr:non-specific lipid-transfer protein type D [Citrullus colocynthis]